MVKAVRIFVFLLLANLLLLPYAMAEGKPVSDGNKEVFDAAKKTFEENELQDALTRFRQFIVNYTESSTTINPDQYSVFSRVKPPESTVAGTGKGGIPAEVAAVEWKENRVSGGSMPRELVDTAYAPVSGTPPALNTIYLDFEKYLAGVFLSNTAYMTDRAEFDRLYTNSIAALQAYDLNLTFDPGVTAYYDDKTKYGADLTFNLKKILYDGGKKNVLKNELEIVKYLSKAGMVESRNNITLIAVNYYVDLYSLQEEFSVLQKKILKYQLVMRNMEAMYQKGLAASAYDYYSAKILNLAMERELLKKKAELLKSEVTFRQFGRIYSDSRIELAPLSLNSAIDFEGLQKSAVANNSSIKAARLRKELQMQKIEEKAAENRFTINFKSSLGIQVGSPDYTGVNNTFGAGTNPVATIGFNASIPIIDGGVRKSNILVEELEALKQKLALEKTTEEIIKKINDMYTDFKSIEKDREITQEIIALNKQRFLIAMERFEKGLEAYRSVREAWSDSIVFEMELVRQNTLMQKLILDMSVVSGRNIFSL